LEVEIVEEEEPTGELNSETESPEEGIGAVEIEGRG
jgi:hypothetical protein